MKFFIIERTGNGNGVYLLDHAEEKWSPMKLSARKFEDILDAAVELRSVKNKGAAAGAGFEYRIFQVTYQFTPVEIDVKFVKTSRGMGCDGPHG